MSNNNSVGMVNTRATIGNQEVTMDSVQDSLTRMMEMLDNVTNKLTDHDRQFIAFQNELASIRSREGPSNRTNGVPMVTRQNETQYWQFGRMSKMEFPRFNGEDVKGWIFRCR